MQRRKIVLISICMLTSICTVCGLYAYTSRYNHYGNGFVRLFPSHIFSGMSEMNLGSTSHYICGTDKVCVYLGNYDNPKELMVLDRHLSTFSRQTLVTPDSCIIQKSSASLHVDSPDIFLTDGVSHYLLKWQLPSLRLKEIQQITSNTLALPISATSVVLKLYNGKIHQSILAKYNFDLPAPSNELRIKKQVDGFFCSDGELHYSKSLSTLVYVYFFRNQFICTDTNLNLRYYGKTIDTNTKAKIKVAAIRNNTYTLSSPPMYVNNTSCVDDNQLYINSGLKATNESKEQFDQSSVIDIYSLKTGLYKYSFYVPDFNGKKITNFKVDDRQLFVVQGKNLSVYQLNLP